MPEEKPVCRCLIVRILFILELSIFIILPHFGILFLCCESAQYKNCSEKCIKQEAYGSSRSLEKLFLKIIKLQYNLNAILVNGKPLKRSVIIPLINWLYLFIESLTPFTHGHFVLFSVEICPVVLGQILKVDNVFYYFG